MRIATSILTVLLAWTGAVHAEMSYNKCAQGKAFGCVATTDAEKAQCEDTMGGCGQWVTISVPFSVAPDAFSYERSPLGGRANYFVDEVAKQVYGAGMPTHQDGTLFTTGELYADPVAHGWRVLGEDESYRNAIALWPGVAGVVVADVPDARGAERLRKVDVLYSSHRLEGRLRVLPASSVDKENTPKFVVPTPAPEE